MGQTVYWDRFEWDRDKDNNNYKKHAINFQTASEVFSDPYHVTILDCDHSDMEERWYCLGYVRGRIATVRYTLRGERIRIIGAGYWKEKEYMKKKTDPKFDADGYEEDFDGLNSRDFVVAKDPRLPSPAELAKSMKKAKMTIVIDVPTKEFFKKKASQHGVSYQKMIRRVLREYVQQMKGAA